MPSSPRVSIVLCTWNGASRLAGQVDSLLAQSCGDFELLAVDDASTDDTAQILHGYATRDARVRVVVNAANLGYNANFARAFALARADLLAPCDQDDAWHPEKLAVLAGALGEADLAYCDSELVDGAGRPTGRRLSEQRCMYQGADPLALVTTNSVSGHAMIFRRQLLGRAAPFPPGIHYDWWLALVAATGSGIRYVDRPLVQFRRHDAAATGIGRKAAPPPLRAWLEERRLLLRALEHVAGARRDDVAALLRSLDAGLDRGDWLGLVRLAWRHRAPLTAILGPGWVRVARRGLASALSAAWDPQDGRPRRGTPR